MDKSPQATPPAPPAAVAQPDPDLSGRVLDDFRLLRRIGQGGMGQVYLAEQISLRRQVALKVVRPDLAEGGAAAATLLKRFKAEAEAVARATHANIVQIYAIGQAGDLNYMALEYVEGRNLRELVERHKPITVAEGLKIMAQIAAALQRAGELNIVHRDIKPENILVARNDDVKVADFGLSRCFDRPLGLTRSGVVMGTPLYMSPEQVELKAPVDHRSDIYSFGATGYFLFAGIPPFRGETPIEVAYQHVHNEPTPLGEYRPDLPARLCAVIHRMMAKKPDDRYQTAGEVAREVEWLRQHMTAPGSGEAPALTMRQAASPTMHVSAASAGRPWYRRHSIGIAAVAFALIVGLAIGWYRHRPASTLNPADGVVRAQSSREQGLREQVEKDFKPYHPLGQDPSAVIAAVDLGLLYLEERRLREAEEFFNKKLCPDGEENCKGKLLKQLGLAMVLAFSNKAKESNLQFLAIATELNQLDRVASGAKPAVTKPKQDVDMYVLLWKTNPPAPALRAMVARALHHNEQNGVALPAALDDLRYPPGLRPKDR